MSNFFDKGLHHLGKTGQQVFVMNIGAMDGVLFDEMIGYTNMYNFKGLYVEPIPYLFDKLKNNIGDKGIFENSAISDYNGEIEMLTIDKDVIDSGAVHNCFYGMSAVYPPRNGLGSEFDRPTVEKYGKLVKVSCITFETLLKKHNITNFDVVKIDAEGHDYQIFKQIDLGKYRPKIVRIEWVNLSDEEKNEIKNIFNKYDYQIELDGQDIIGLPSEFHNELFKPKQYTSTKITLVTGLWDIGRNELSTGWSRTFDHYLEKFEQLLKVENDMIIFGDKELESFVFKHRGHQNTQFILRELSWFKQNEFYDLIQNIRSNPEWYNSAGWLKESTQAKLEWYNPLVMSKMFLLHDAKIFDKFDSKYLFWVDAGITNTVHQGYFTNDKVLEKLSKYINKFSFICFPYQANNEIHGFDFNAINRITGNKVEMVGRGGFFGGPKESITDVNNIYYSLMSSTLKSGYMGTEESLFSIMCYKHSDLVNYFEIENNGLLGTFFENLKNDKLVVKTKNPNGNIILKDKNNTALYIISFNSPNQVQTLIDSMLIYDDNFVKKPKLILLNNSTDDSTTEGYNSICEKYGIEHIRKDNLGICGGRQFIAEHAEERGYDFYFFFEDDMFFYNKENSVCKNGFNRVVKNLYDKSLDIINKNGYDFLKLSFTEFYGDNRVQWSWYNVPQSFREQHWPDKKTLPVQGLDPNAPRTKFNKIECYQGIPYADGEVYYCNWPQIVSREGNRKMFLTEKWARPYEQTWMSYIFQETIKGNVKPALLLLTPTEHNRFEHYDGKLRKES